MLVLFFKKDKNLSRQPNPRYLSKIIRKQVFKLRLIKHFVLMVKKQFVAYHIFGSKLFFIDKIHMIHVSIGKELKWFYFTYKIK